ncbi:hypothetical protein MFLAVUS_003756 [Mucor flavus]|uniref:RNA polymerase II assembly factor Rtp1 C-terminal domain-containing protein n=1 Tax=Mucor flavus TaxID=439312 RepID=A0ABP9YU30_9FUNG
MTSIDSYYAIVAPQLLHLLKKEPPQSPTSQAVTFIIGRIIDKPTQIISFATNIVNGHVERLMTPKHKQEKKKAFNGLSYIAYIVGKDPMEEIEEAHDKQFSVEDDFESLILAINLLGAVMHENDQLSNHAVKLLISSMEPLKKLKSHTFELVNEVLLALQSYLPAQKMSNMKHELSASIEASKEKYCKAIKLLQDDLLPIRAHSTGLLAKDPLVSSDSYIYVNAVEGLSALTDAYGNQIIKKLAQKLDNRLRIGGALLQTYQRCGTALGKYANTLIKPLETALARREEDLNLRVSALSLLCMTCQTRPIALSSQMSELIDWVLNTLEIEKAHTFIILAATVLILSLSRGLAA